MVLKETITKYNNINYIPIFDMSCNYRFFMRIRTIFNPLLHTLQSI